MAPTSQQAKASKAKVLSGNSKNPKARVQRYLKSTESQLVEPAKSTLLLKGIRCSQAMGTILKDLRAVQAPHAKLLSKKNAVVPFTDDGQHSLEFLTTKNDCSLFVMASHNKKRPNNLILGRTFDRQVLDMVELGVLRYKSLADYGGSVPKKRVGSKPLVLFVGDVWENQEGRKLQNMLLDLYRGDPVSKIVASGFDHAIVFTGAEHQDKILYHQRTYFCKLKKNPNRSATTTGKAPPLPHLIPCGPDMDFQIRRTQFASSELYGAALKQPKAVFSAKSKAKNHTTNMFGETIGRLHLEYQDVSKRQGRHAKALRVASKQKAQEEQAMLENELGRETQEIKAEFKQQFGFEE